MFFRKRPKVLNEIVEIAESSHSRIQLPSYRMPEEMLQDIEREAHKITEAAIEHNLIDEFSLVEMEENSDFFINRMIHHMFVKPINYLKSQKLTREWQTIHSIKIILDAQLRKAQMDMDFTVKELARCEAMLKEIETRTNKDYKIKFFKIQIKKISV